MHDRETAVLVQALEARHAGVEAEVLVDPAQALRPDADARPQPVVDVVGVRHDGVQSVVTAGHLEHDQDALVDPATGSRGRARRRERPCQAGSKERAAHRIGGVMMESHVVPQSSW